MRKQLHWKLLTIATFYIPRLIHKQQKYPFVNSGGVDIVKWKRFFLNNNYIVRRLSINKTHLLHRIGLRKCTPQADLADIFVRETDWQKDDQMTVAYDDPSWNTNFRCKPISEGLPDHSQNSEDTEYVLTYNIQKI